MPPMRRDSRRRVLAFVTIDPQAPGFQFVRADKDGVRKLIVRDGQHEYAFDEVK